MMNNSGYNIKISTNLISTSKMTLRVMSNNLSDGESVRGCIKSTNENLDLDINADTTEWFYIDPITNKYLTISGGFNTSIWQFKDADNNIIKIKAIEGNFNNLESHYTGNKIYSTVEIPNGSVMARVTYWVEKEDTIDSSDIYIVPGQYPQNKGQRVIREIEIPALEAGESISYNSEEKKWKLLKNGDIVKLLDDMMEFQIVGDSMMSLSGDICGLLEFDYTAEKMDNQDNVYGVRWNIEDLNPICERVGDSENFEYGYFVDNRWIGTNNYNDFDVVSPWSDIRLCTIDEQGNINYDNLSLIDDHVDIMVEIPKFYFKREIIEGFEYLWVSPNEINGYTIDPAFELANGVVDYIYVGAYLANISDKGIGSRSRVNPLINYSLNDVKDEISIKGANWGEIDLVTLNMLQKLFLVETACKNSQALFMGVTNLSWGSCYSLTSSNEKTNSITLESNDASKKISEGDAVTLFQVPQNESYYDTLATYENNEKWHRVVDKVIKNDNGTLTIHFSGDPIIIVEQQTMIMSLPNMNGETDTVDYHTGQSIDEFDGKTSFKYRYIENLWGSVCVMLDGATVSSNTISITYPNNSVKELSFLLPSQEGTTSEGVSPSKASIKRMGFDDNNTSIFLPSEVSNGASSVTGWCDALFYTPSDETFIVTYGLTWDLRQYAGIFGYRMNISSSMPRVESGARLIFR